MIKFWKSAGKSGCPVRPPELNSSTDSESKVHSLQSLEGNEDTQHIFEKKSKLSLNLDDVLHDKKALKYFIQFMETIGQHLLIKCWVELENFKVFMTNAGVCNSIDNYSKINRTQSFDLHSKCESYYEENNELKSQIYKWRQTTDTNIGNNSNTINFSSVSSCGNLAEHVEKESADNCTNRKKLTEEAINLFKKYIALEAPYKLDLPDSLRKSIISNICHPEGQVREDCFQPVQNDIFNQMENKYFKDFLNSPLYIKAQIDILTGGSLDLKDILNNETILFYFTEYVDQESCKVLLEFLMAVTNFRDNIINGKTYSTDQAQADAIVLYDKYFSLQAINPIGFTTDVRLNIESDICREGGPLSTCFDMPYIIVYKTLTQYVNMFLESELYYKYLSEMINSIDKTWTAKHKSYSDCSSEFSISTQNTLLAMGDPVFRKKRNHSVPDMSIDSNQLYNADSLWQRHRYDGLSIGRVNSLGRFESKFDPDPDKRDKSILKKIVSRFVPSHTTTKVEEEMAWQIAHMIVKDVTDLTMAPPDNAHGDI
ncbi:hypothetical protein K1T71_003984 [Dendrolimus kikuchii]|uniref:Uncharacterized protein n=1 Tax=Dendrolimus kikuchii TaxID=765133 RepID=A0ACC1D9Q1_9NEOP|nr:hypothetical protein K1T71_003984 [Dendrolimus kikuchii]